MTNPLATLKYAVEAVPFFDGSNIPLHYFIKGCEEAKSMLPKEAEAQFTKVVRTRIVGEARRTIQDEEFETISQLTTYLKRTYGTAKNVYQLQGELGCIYQMDAEDVVTYANRVKSLGKQILEAYRSSGAPPDQSIKTSLEKDMCKCFIRGLKPAIEQRINRELNVHETVADALRIERELKTMTDLRQGPRGNAGQKGSQPDLGTEILICQICKKRGHGADKCRMREPRARQVNLIQGKLINCQLCSKPGHDAKTCRQNNNNNRTLKSTVICQWCDRAGHSAINCWKKQNEQRSEDKIKTICQICDRVGHTAKECRSKNNQQPTKDNSFCRYCKESGHLLEDCKLRAASNNRRKETNQGNYKGPLTSGVQQGTERGSHPPKSREATA